MSEESTTPDLVELMRGLSDAPSVEETIGYYAPDAVYDMSKLGMGVFVGRTAIRTFLDDWETRYEDLQDEVREIVDLGGGVVLLDAQMSAHVVGSPAHARVNARYGYVFVWVDGKVTRATPYPDIEEARAAAERLVEERE